MTQKAKSAGRVDAAYAILGGGYVYVTAADSQAEIASRLLGDPFATQCDTQVVPLANSAESIEETAMPNEHETTSSW